MSPLDAKARDVARIVTENAAEWDAAKEDELAAAIVALWRGWAEPILRTVAYEVRPCLACQAPIAFVRTVKGTILPLELMTGTNHFGSCPHPERFRRPRSRHPEDGSKSAIAAQTEHVDAAKVDKQQRLDGIPPGRIPG